MYVCWEKKNTSYCFTCSNITVNEICRFDWITKPSKSPWFTYFFNTNFTGSHLLYLCERSLQELAMCKYYRYLFNGHVRFIYYINYWLPSSVRGAVVAVIYGSWIYNYLCNQCPSPLKWWVRTPFMARCTPYNIMW